MKTLIISSMLSLIISVVSGPVFAGGRSGDDFRFYNDSKKADQPLDTQKIEQPKSDDKQKGNPGDITNSEKRPVFHFEGGLQGRH